MVKLIEIIKSPLKEKKYRAVFDDGTHTDFGAAGYEDFTIHKNVRRKDLYDLRHRKNENWNNYKSAGALSKWILWNKPTFNASVADYKKRFNL